MFNVFICILQKLVLKHLSSVGMALIYHLAEMRGMVRFGGAYEALGLRDETPITNAISAAQSFLAKTSEVQQVIDHSMRDYKAFIRYVNVLTSPYYTLQQLVFLLPFQVALHNNTETKR